MATYEWSFCSNIERRRQVLQYLIQMVPNAENVNTSNLNNVVTYICNRILVFWKSSGRKKCAVFKIHADWFSEKQNVNVPKVNKKALIVDLEQPSSSGPLGASTAAGGKKDFWLVVSGQSVEDWQLWLHLMNQQLVI